MKRFLMLWLCVAAVTASAVFGISAADHVHEYGNWVTVSEPTCAEAGLRVRGCACGEGESAPLPATGHSFGKWETVLESTCILDGLKARTCPCGKTETQVLNATGHTFGIWTEGTDGGTTRACLCGAVETATETAEDTAPAVTIDLPVSGEGCKSATGVWLLPAVLTAGLVLYTKTGKKGR